MKFDTLNPIAQVSDNVILTNLGDISLCYKIQLPEINTVSSNKFNALHQAMMQLFLLLPENVLLHRQDIFLWKKFDVGTLFSKDKDFFETSLYNQFKEREYLEQNSYLYITLLDGFGLKREIRNIGLFKKVTNVANFEKKINDFVTRTEKAVALLKETLPLRALTENEIITLLDNHLNGYEYNKVVSPVFKPTYKVGNKFFSCYGLDKDINQKEGDIYIAVPNESMERKSELADKYEMYESYMSKLGYALNFEHVLNTYIFYDVQSSIKKEMIGRKSKLNGVKFLGKLGSEGNEENANRLTQFLADVEKENVKIVRTHINVSLWDYDLEKLRVKDSNIQSSFGRMGIVPSEYIYSDLPYIFISGFAGCGGYLPKDYTFISYLDLSLAYCLSEGAGIFNSKIGYYYTNRNNDIPFKLDTFVEPYESKKIDNRNYFVIAPSGGGKSFASRSRLLQQYQMGFDQVVINIGGDDKLCRVINSLHEGDALYIKYEQGQTLSINPFYVEGSISNDKIEFLINFIWLLWWSGSKDIDEDPDKASILNKILLSYYDVDVASQDNKGNFSLFSEREEYSVVNFYDYLINNEEKILALYRGDTSLFNLGSLILNLEKFAVGNYSKLFIRTKPAFEQKRKYIEFELDNIKDHPFLFPIFSMLISDITFNTMWTTEGYKDFFIDEAWKILEKKGMSSLLKYLYKTIRKFDGAVGIAVQQITDLSGDVIVENAILGNCSIKYILDHRNSLSTIETLKEKLSLTDTDISMLLSIKNKTKKEDKIKYTEQLLVMGADFSRIVRLETSPELAVIFDSEKSRLQRFEDLYKENNNDIKKTITAYLA